MKKLNLKYSLILLLFLSFFSQGQVNCVVFKDTIGCTPFKVEIEYCGPLQSNGKPFPSFYNFETGVTTPPPVNNSTISYTYENAGIFDLRQVIAINEGVNQGQFDTTYQKAFRVVSTPTILSTITPCHNKNLNVSIDSSSYDFYVITNSITPNTDTIFNFGDKSLDFSAFVPNNVDITIVGQYFEAPCSTTETKSSILVPSMLPNEINFLTEYITPNVSFSGTGPFNYDLSLMEASNTIHTKKWLNETIIEEFPNTINNYETLSFDVSDACNTNLNIFTAESFTSSTTFENNRNIIAHTSPTFTPLSFNFLKATSDSFEIINTSIDSNIICNDTNCYFLRTQQSINTYNFDHFSSGNCGRSFSNDIPKHFSTYQLDNSSSDSLFIIIEEPEFINAIEINNTNFLLNGNPSVGINKDDNCIDFKFQNSCNIWSPDTILCPLILSYENENNLMWNSTSSENFHALWTNQNGKTDTLFFNSSSPKEFTKNDYPAQNFCISIISNTTKSKSNQICFDLTTFVFIPEIALSNQELQIKDRFLISYTIQLFDLNGNLSKELNELNKSLKGLEPGTYFYILQGISETGESLKTNGSILIK